jgi:hypothetical protein
MEKMEKTPVSATEPKLVSFIKKPKSQGEDESV